MSGAYEVYASKTKFAFISFIAFVSVAYCIHVLVNKEPEPFLSKWQFLFEDTHKGALVALIILLLFLIFSLKNLLSSKPVIIVNGEGIYDSRHINETIPWNGIIRSGCQSVKFNGAKLHILGMELTEYQKSNTRFTWFYHVNAPFYKSDNPNVVCFHLNGLDIDYDELERAIYAQRNARKIPTNSINMTRRLFG